jgi:hypothetical protein
MVYRDQSRTELCSVCRAEAEARCKRCGRPLCRLHTPGRSARCQPCEAWFDEERARRIDRSGAFSMSRMTLPPTPAAVAILLTPAGLVGAAILWERARRRRERNRFLAERVVADPQGG